MTLSDTAEMPALKLYDFGLSLDCYKVRLFLSLLTLDYEPIPIDCLPGREHLEDSFASINPLRGLPVLDDDGLLVRDAQAILCHLANAYDREGHWLPVGKSLLGPVMAWLGFAGVQLAPIGSARLGRLFGVPCDLEEDLRRGRWALRQIEDHLARQDCDGAQWLVGETPTIADIACFPAVALSGDCGIDHASFPAIRGWVRRVRGLSGFVGMPGVPDFL